MTLIFGLGLGLGLGLLIFDFPKSAHNRFIENQILS